MPSRRATTSIGPAHSAPYGQACIHCFKAKCRCVARTEGSGCERCHRLQKACHSADSVRKRTKQKASLSGDRVAQIEEKLDSLVSLLHSVAKSPSSTAALRDAVNNSAGESRETSQRQQQQHLDTPVSLSNGVAVETSTDSPAGADSTFDTLSDEALQTVFGLFRERFLPFCPFMSFSPDTTAKELQRERPFLLRCIVAVTTSLTQEKIAHGRAIKQILAREALVDNRSTVDLLLGVLTYANWGCDQLINRAGTLSRLVTMALSIVCDLWMNKPLPPDQHMIANYTADVHKCYGDEVESGTEQALEQQRAVLGCFLITSFVSIYFSQIDGMRWTPHMDDCLRAIQSRKECPGDLVLAHQVRLQLILQRAIHAREQSLRDQSGAFLEKTPSLPAYLTQAFQAQLQEIKAAIPPDLEPQAIFAAHVHYVELSLNEMTYSANYCPTTATTPTSHDASSSASDIERVQCYWRSVHSIRALFDALLEVPASSFVGISFIVWAQLSRGIVTLIRLSTLQMPSWDCRAVRNTVDLLDILDRIVEKIKGAAAGPWLGAQASDDIFAQVANIMRVLRAVVASKLAAETTMGTPAWTVESVMAQSTEGWGDVWLEGMFPRMFG